MKGNTGSYSSAQLKHPPEQGLHSLLYLFLFHLLPGPKASATYFKFLLQE